MWSDPSMNMAYGNQWMNPALYKNMTNEQVDWASLAQQWIKMKETPPAMPPGQQNRPAAASCEPNLIRPTQPVDRQNSQGATAPNKALGDHNVPVPNTGNTIEKPSAWNSWTWQQQQQWNWNWASSPTVPPVKTVNPVRPPYVAPPILSEPPPSFPMISTQTNKPFPANHFWAGPNTRVPPPEPDQWNNKQPNILNVEDRSQDLSFIDAAKRKQLPAWIREGLEKMEREKRRKMEREQSFDESDYSNLNNESVSNDMHKSPNNFDNETQMADNSPDHNDFESRKADFVKDESPPLIPRKTKAQIWEDTMFSLRQTLTKLLMDVTNDMMLSVVKEVVKTTAQTDIQGNQSQTSLAGKLGLGDYGSESGSSDESDEEQQTPSHKQSLKPDSDEAIQERIIKRQREFNNIEARILMELDQLEDREKLVRSKFDSSVKLSGDNNDNGSQVVENIQTKGRVEDEGSSQKLDKGHDKSKKELPNVTNSKNGQKKKKSKYKRSSSSSGLSSSSDSKKSDDSDGKYCYKKNDKVKSKSSNKRSKNDGVKRKRRSRSRNRSRSYSRTKRSRSRSRNKSRSRSRHRSRSHSRHYDRRSPHSYRSRRSRSPASRHGSSRKYKSKRNSSSSSNESRSIKHRYRR